MVATGWRLPHARSDDFARRWSLFILGRLVAVCAGGASSDTLFEFDHAKTDSGSPGRIRIQLIVEQPSWARLQDGRIAWTALDRDYVQVHDSTGRIVARIRHAQWQSREVTSVDRSAMVELLRIKLRAIGGDASFADSPQVEAPERFPAITAVRAGPQGTLWVQLMGPVERSIPWRSTRPIAPTFLGGSTWHARPVRRVPRCDPLPRRFRIFA
jgi:hypothetical protein